MVEAVRERRRAFDNGMFMELVTYLLGTACSPQNCSIYLRGTMYSAPVDMRFREQSLSLFLRPD